MYSYRQYILIGIKELISLRICNKIFWIHIANFVSSSDVEKKKIYFWSELLLDAPGTNSRIYLTEVLSVSSEVLNGPSAHLTCVSVYVRMEKGTLGYLLTQKTKLLKAHLSIRNNFWIFKQREKCCPFTKKQKEVV